MIIDQSPISSFLMWALYIVGIPGIILSILVLIKVTRSFYGKRDYNREIPEDQSSGGTTQATAGHEDKHSGESSVHRSNSSRDSINPRMIQSG